MLKYNTLYQSLKKVSAEWHAGHVQWGFAWDYLKFYEDGTVISCYSNGDTDNIDKWFNKDNSESPFSKGTFELKSNATLEIKLSGSLQMDGNAMNRYLILRSFNPELKQGEKWDYYTVVDYH
jgi:hypothetical protein